MSGSEYLASPTLAQLYLAQGHMTQARDQVRALLERDSFHPVALAIAKRIAATERPSLQLDADRSLRMTWQIPPRLWRKDLHLVLCVTPRGARCAPHYLSGPAQSARDEMHMPFPYSTGSATACIAALRGEKRSLSVLACAAPIAW